MKWISLVIILILLSGCVDVETPVIVEDGDVLPENICDRLDSSVIVIHKSGCPGCAIAIPRLEELEKELGKEFVYLNVSVEKERTKLLALGFIPKLVPTLVIDCKVYSRVLSKEGYRELIE